jgi:hypothetical protein
MGLCGAGAMEQMLENAGGESRVSGFPPRLAGLLRADAYPHPVSEVRLLQTHMSWVLLAGDYAYKIKRPVFYPFVDFRDPAARAHFCHEELRLNRRFAPELYLSVEPVCERDGSAVMGGAGVPLEHAVRMRRFDGSQELDQLVLAGAVDPGELRAFGAALAMRHEQLDVDARTAACEVVSRTGEVLQTNLRELGSVAASAALELGLDAVGSALDRVLLEAIGSLSTRALGSRIRECHGDLHLSNIVRIGGVLVPFDCLEFDPRLRWIDVADEVAFLYADLWAYGREDLARGFLAGYVETSGDYNLCRVLDLFIAHRALVRAKVLLLRSLEDAGPVRALSRQRSAGYVAVASAALRRRQGRLVLMSGLSGSGKSWLATRAAAAAGALLVRSDVERKRLAGLKGLADSGSPLEGGIYTPRATGQTYGRLLRCAEDVVVGGRVAIVDATFLRREQREPFARLARECGIECLLVECVAPEAVIEARIRDRQAAGGDPSEAGLDVLGLQRRIAEPVAEAEGIRVLRIDTSLADPLAQTLALGFSDSARG